MIFNGKHFVYGLAIHIYTFTATIERNKTRTSIILNILTTTKTIKRLEFSL